MAMVLLARGRAGDLARAERYASRALKLGGSLTPYALDTLASVYLAQGRGPEALRAMNDALAAVPPENQDLRDALMRSRQKLETHP
jgi:hypothetical protein